MYSQARDYNAALGIAREALNIEQQAMGLERIYDRACQQAEEAAHGGVACRA